MDIAKNIGAIRKEKGLNQQVIADALNLDISVVSNIENGRREVKVNELEIIANSLNVDMLYLLTYPHVYVRKDGEEEKPIEAILQIKLRAEKKEQVLKLVFGESNLEILNK